MAYSRRGELPTPALVSSAGARRLHSSIPGLIDGLNQIPRGNQSYSLFAIVGDIPRWACWFLL